MVTISNQEHPVLQFFRENQKSLFPVSYIVDMFVPDDNPVQARALRKKLCKFAEAGALERVETGVYRYAGGLKVGQGTAKNEVMWRVLRARRMVSVDDIIELAGVSEKYAREFFTLLISREVAVKVKPNVIRLVKDTVEMPRDKKRADKDRAIRRQKALAALANVQAALDEARTAIAGMEG
jgi:hypothetical protein